jgi:hypothetical protein
VSPPLGGVIIYQVFNGAEILALAAIAIKASVPDLSLDLGVATLEAAF